MRLPQSGISTEISRELDEFIFWFVLRTRPLFGPLAALLLAVLSPRLPPGPGISFFGISLASFFFP